MPGMTGAALVLHDTFDDRTGFTSATGDLISDASRQRPKCHGGSCDILWNSGGAIDAATNTSYFSPSVPLSAGLVPANEYTLATWVTSSNITNFEDWGQVVYSDNQVASSAPWMPIQTEDSTTATPTPIRIGSARTAAST